jgi:Zn-dependent peptidase ImmA (M78 family)
LIISRLDLDGIGSPLAIAARIHEIEADLPLAVPVEALCQALDILNIDEIETSAFEAALVMDVNKAVGGILVAAGRPRTRRRYSIGHELGHFLIPTHRPHTSEGFSCSLDDLHQHDPKERDRRRRIEAEANRFAAALLMPPRRIRAAMKSASPDLGEIVRLAHDFDVSKEAMARAYVGAQREAIAIVILQHGHVLRIYRHDDMPWIAAQAGRPVPVQSIGRNLRMEPRYLSAHEDCDPLTWVAERDAKRIDLLTEQVLAQRDGFALLLLRAEIAEEDDDEGDYRSRP